MNIPKSFLGLFFIFIFGSSGIAQNNWILQKEKDGIRISGRRTTESSFNDIRVELDLTGNIDQLATLLLDIPGYTAWAYATKKSVVIKNLGPGKLIYYSEIEVPWPATNRYFYAQFELKEDSLAHSIQVLAINLPDYTPVPRDL